jgi:broad specificity phosphatase PhoE
MTARLYVIRHGETAWSLSGQHTGRTDIPLTTRGHREAVALGREIRDIHFPMYSPVPCNEPKGRANWPDRT